MIDHMHVASKHDRQARRVAMVDGVTADQTHYINNINGLDGVLAKSVWVLPALFTGRGGRTPQTLCCG